MRPSRHDPIAALEWLEPISVGGDMTLRAIAVVLDRYGVGFAIVRTDDEVGALSERDIVAGLAAGGDPDRLWGRDVMTPGLVSIPPVTPILDAARQMIEGDVRHLAIVDGDDVVGVVSMRDLFEVLVDEWPT